MISGNWISHSVDFVSSSELYESSVSHDAVHCDCNADSALFLNKAPFQLKITL